MDTITADQFFLLGGIIILALILLMAGIITALRSRHPDPAAHKPVASEKAAPDWLKSLADTASKTITRTPGSPILPSDALLVMRDPASGNWMVEINGMQYTSLKDIHDDRAASKVLEAMVGLQQFAGFKPVTAGQEQLTLASTDQAAPTALSTTAASQPTHPAPPNSMLDQIEKVLQRNLLKHPELASRKIHVGAASDGSLLIEMDKQFYHGIEEVPDPVVRDLLRAAIQEWEHTT